MRLYAIRFMLLIAFLQITELLSAQKTANQILYSLYQKSLLINDYSAEANIKVDIPFIRMLPVDANIYYKKPDKFRVKTTGIAILPKQGFNDFSKTIQDTNTYTAIIIGKEKIGNSFTTIINVMPNDEADDLILGKLWIDADKNMVMKSQFTTKSNGTILITYYYATQAAYGLPDSLTFTVDVKKFKIPKGVAADINNTKTNETDNSKEPKKGKIYIVLKNYKVNKGIADAVFKD